jgi:hypothetical protein
MKWRDHPTAEAARTELVANGYVDVHTSPDQPQLWGKPMSPERLAISCDAPAGHYSIVDYADYVWLLNA